MVKRPARRLPEIALRRSWIVVWVGVLVVSACGDGTVVTSVAAEATTVASTQTLPETPTTVVASPASTGAPESTVVATTSVPYENVGAATFSDPTTVDNSWFPLVPGTQFVYAGVTQEEDDIIPHRVVFTVTDLTKVVDGVRTRVAWDRDFSDSDLVETEIVFFGQDDQGNVWHFGQYPEEYEDGEFVAAPTWISGVGDGRAGISMKTNPEPGTPSYSQGWSPAVDWTDRGQVDGFVEQLCVPVDCYRDVLVIDEFNVDEPGAFQVKYYARDTGNVAVGWKGEDPEQETLELVALRHLDQAAMERVRTEALALESRAYEISPDVYGQTEPIEVP